MTIGTRYSDLRARLVDATPVVLRPVLAALFVGAGVLVASFAGVLVHRLFGEWRSVDLRFVALLTIWFSTAALAHGICTRYLVGAWTLRPWVHGAIVSVVLWGCLPLLGPNAGITSSDDVVALAAVTCVFALLFGFGLWRGDRRARAGDA